MLDLRQDRLLQLRRRRDGHGGGERVVGRLRHVDVIVGMDRLLAAHLTAGDLDSTIGYYFVGIHVRLRAAACLPDAEREMVIEFPGNDFIAGLNYELALLLGEFTEVTIHERGSLLEDAERTDELERHHVTADVEMDEGTGGLRAVIAIGGHLDGAQAVGFSASVHIGWVRNSTGGNVLSLFGVVRETGDDARTAFVCAVGVSPPPTTTM